LAATAAVQQPRRRRCKLWQEQQGLLLLRLLQERGLLRLLA
jgi:hypothetical protein